MEFIIWRFEITTAYLYFSLEAKKTKRICKTFFFFLNDEQYCKVCLIMLFREKHNRVIDLTLFLNTLLKEQTLCENNKNQLKAFGWSPFESCNIEQFFLSKSNTDLCSHFSKASNLLMTKATQPTEHPHYLTGRLVSSKCLIHHTQSSTITYATGLCRFLYTDPF